MVIRILTCDEAKLRLTSFRVYCLRFNVLSCSMFEVKLFVARLCADWDAQSDKMRKAWSMKDGNAIHVCCGIFLHMLEVLQQKAPSSEFAGFADSLMKVFMCGIMDAELTHIAESSVPPADLMAVGAFRPWTCV